MKTIGESYVSWIINDVKNKDLITNSIVTGKEIDALISEGKYEQAEILFKKVALTEGTKIHPRINDFFENLKNIKIIKTERDNTEKIPMGLYNALFEQLQKNPNDKVIIEINQEIDFIDSKAISKKIWETLQKLIFIISPKTKYEGRIITDYNQNDNLELIRGYLKEGQDGTIKNITTIGGINSQNKGQKCQGILTMRTNKYLFQTNDGRMITIYSSRKLDLGRCEIRGMTIPINDRSKIGEEAKNRTVIDIMLVTKHEGYTNKLTPDEAEKIRKTYDYEKFMKQMLGHFRHPKWFEKFMTSILLTVSDNEYPAHLLFMGPAGSGKTRGLLKPLEKSFDEPSGIVSGTSTIKGLIPSFKESPPTPGHLCLSEKISLIDEFFNFIKTSTKNGDMGEDFSKLKDVLDHEEKNYTSGCGSIKTVMRSIMIATTNEDKYNKLTSIPDICERIDRPFLSRLILYKQNDQHIKFINDRKQTINEIPEKERYPQINKEFLIITEYLKSIRVKGFDFKKVEKQYNELSELIPSICNEVYMGRYSSHLKNIITGIAKLRWLTNEKTELTFDDKDYEEGLIIFENIIGTWIDEESIKKLPIRARVNRLGYKEKQVYDILEGEFQPLSETVNVCLKLTNLTKTQIEYSITRLINLDVIKIIEKIGYGDYYVPHWYTGYNKTLTEDY